MKGMTCTQVRRLLAAYRRDDWSPRELEAFGGHISMCAECRRVEASFRSVGERVRQLPTITPPASLRERVFAAIREESAASAPALARLTNDETQPKLQVVRGRATAPRRRQIVLGTPAAIAVAAALLLSLVGARLVPAISHDLPSIAASLANIAPNSLTQAGAPHISRYAAPADSGAISSALASSQWVVFVAAANGNTHVEAMNRTTHQITVLGADSRSGSAAALGLVDHWALWVTGDSSATSAWTLWASALPGTHAPASSQPFALLTSPGTSDDAPALLDGTWIAGNTALAAVVTRSGESRIVRFDLAVGQSSATSRVVAHSGAGHVFSDPSMAGGQYYWADAWADGNGALHSDVWRGDDAGATTAVTSNGATFAPRVAGRSLVMIQSNGPILLDPAQFAAGPTQAVRAMVQLVGGTLYAQSLTAGTAQRMNAHVMAGSLAVSDALLVWRDGGQVHSFDLGRNAPSAVDRDLRGAAFEGATSTALAWGGAHSSVIDVYDHA